MDTIFLSDLEVPAIIGTYETEREVWRTLHLNIELGIDLQQAGKTDNLADTVNYVAVEAAILKLGRESRFFLLERFANEVCQIVFAIDERIQKICVTITKPGAITHAAGVGCHIERFR